MFDFLRKKEMDRQAAENFWKWFSENESTIISQIKEHDSAFVWDIDERLKPVFPYFHKELEFQLGYNEGKGEFFFFHFGNKQLKRDAEIFCTMMPRDCLKNWTMILER